MASAGTAFKTRNELRNAVNSYWAGTFNAAASQYETIMYQTFRFYTYAVRKDFRMGARDNWNILWLIFHGVMIGIIIQEWTIFRTLNQNHKGSVIPSRWTASQRWSIQNPLRWKKLSNQHRNFVYHTVHRTVHNTSITHILVIFLLWHDYTIF